MAAEGWYRDPFESHTDRWFSEGTPTSLVGDDNGTESHDPPPAPEVTVELVPSDEPEISTPSDDLLRADEPDEHEPNLPQAAWAAIEGQPMGQVER
ncbi:MAG TPA: hypothetical protein VFE15_10435 [Marmoricola sp.]|jgi:hypothetical protein|nr:hypothetical protein [Marmoricola sp.]